MPSSTFWQLETQQNFWESKPGTHQLAPISSSPGFRVQYEKIWKELIRCSSSSSSSTMVLLQRQIQVCQPFAFWSHAFRFGLQPVCLTVWLDSDIGLGTAYHSPLWWCLGILEYGYLMEFSQLSGAVGLLHLWPFLWECRCVHRLEDLHCVEMCQISPSKIESLKDHIRYILSTYHNIKKFQIHIGFFPNRKSHEPLTIAGHQCFVLPQQLCETCIQDSGMSSVAGATEMESFPWPQQKENRWRSCLIIPVLETCIVWYQD